MEMSPSSEEDLSGKIALVTGATNGIGLVTARELARRGAAVTIIGRSADKLTVTAAVLRAAGGTTVETIQADLSTLSGMRFAAEAFLNRHNRLHILVNNAGAVFTNREVTADGYEKTFALNHLAYFTLTNLLTDALKAAAPARIVNVSSMAHQGARLDFGDLQNERRYSSFGAYAQSKLGNIYFTYELARILTGSGVTVNCLHPGFVASNFGQSNGGFSAFLMRLAQFAAISPDRGALTSLYLAGSPEVEGVSGKYYVNQKAVKSSPVSYDEQAARRLWQVSLKMAGMAMTA
jgi:NAD(P)-dependent dehydrogenase (short-subunit alcohol dehydrogenase family)